MGCPGAINPKLMGVGSGEGSRGAVPAPPPKIFIHGTDKVERRLNGTIFRSCFFRCPPQLGNLEIFLPTPFPKALFNPALE